MKHEESSTTKRINETKSEKEENMHQDYLTWETIVKDLKRKEEDY